MTPLVLKLGGELLETSADRRAMADAIGRLARIDARTCRTWVREHCDVEVVCAAYERTYRSVALPTLSEALARV